MTKRRKFWNYSLLSTEWNPFIVLSCFIAEPGRQGEDAEHQNQSVRIRQSPGLLHAVREGRLGTRSVDCGPYTPPTLRSGKVGTLLLPDFPRQAVRTASLHSPPISERGHHEIHDGLVHGDVHHLVDDAPPDFQPPRPSLVDMAVTVNQYLCTGRAETKGDPWVRPPMKSHAKATRGQLLVSPNGPEKGRLWSQVQILIPVGGRVSPAHSSSTTTWWPAQGVVLVVGCSLLWTRASTVSTTCESVHQCPKH